MVILEKNFIGNEIPADLIKLFHFDQKSKDEYSRGFEFHDLSNKLMIKTYSEDETFLASIIEFAQASASGSHYAIWTAYDKNLNTAPIVIFGDEGGYHVVAENIRQFLQIISSDSEPIVTWDKVIFYKGNQTEDSPRKSEFTNWLLETFNINSTDNVNAVIDSGQRIHSERFNNWMKQFVK